VFFLLFNFLIKEQKNMTSSIFTLDQLRHFHKAKRSSSVLAVHVAPTFATVFGKGPLRSTAHSVPYFFERFPRFFLKSVHSTAIIMLPFCRLKANFSFKREPHRANTLTVLRYSSNKNLILLEFTSIAMRF
jgi:hypothetical protein